MIQGHGIAVAQLHDETGTDGLLSQTQVHLARYPPRLPELANRLLEQAAAEHLPVKGW